jgi:hypothetical protein
MTTTTLPCSREDPEVGALRRENDQLREAMDSRAVIDQAKGALMLRYGLDASAAFELLRRWSQTSNTKVRTIADTLVNVVCQDGAGAPRNPALAKWLNEQVRRPICDTDTRSVPA